LQHTNSDAAVFLENLTNLRERKCLMATQRPALLSKKNAARRIIVMGISIAKTPVSAVH
jgi:hypothetical protein